MDFANYTVYFVTMTGFCGFHEFRFLCRPRKSCDVKRVMKGERCWSCEL